MSNIFTYTRAAAGGQFCFNKNTDGAESAWRPERAAGAATTEHQRRRPYCHAISVQLVVIGKELQPTHREPRSAWRLWRRNRLSVYEAILVRVEREEGFLAFRHGH